MKYFFSFGLFVFVACLTGVVFSPNLSAQTPSDSSHLPVAGKLVEMSAKLPTPLNRQFLGGNDELDEQKTEDIGFQFFLPSNESAKTDAGYPLLLFLHGIGERGNDLEKLKVYGPTKICSDPEKASKWPFILVAPQCPDSHFWSAAQLRLLVEKICSDYPVDKSRIYVTGLSMGGFGTWSILASWPELVAAAAPICGGGDPKLAHKMAHTPIWVFHGEKDPLVPSKASKDMVTALENVGNKDVTLTIYPNVGHDSWTKAYADPRLYEWFLSKKLALPQE